MRKRASSKVQQKKSHSIFRRILRPLCLLAVLDAFILVMVLQAAGVLRQLNQNSFDLFRKQVDNRQSFLQTQMTRRWMQLDDITGFVNDRTQALLQSGKIHLDTLDSNPSESSVLILDIMDELIAELYSKQVSGIYLVFNTHDLQQEAENGDWQQKTGIYIRDNDPLSAASERYADLLLECAPVSVVQSMSLSTDSSWEQRFKFGPDRPYEAWLTEPYTVAVQSRLSAPDCGLWSMRQSVDGTSALSYTVPLILSDGTVYGVLGVEMLPSYLAAQMPTSELDREGVYGILMTEDASQNGILTAGTLCIVSDKSDSFQPGSQLSLTPSESGGCTTKQNGRDYTVSLTPLSLYSRNAPFEHQRWFVLGAVPTDNLFSFTAHVKTMLVLTVIIMLIFGIGGSLAASWHIARPIALLRRELETSWGKGIPHLSATGIGEVDDFAQEITSLSRDVVNSSRRFLSIMEMSSVDMGGYELNMSTGLLFVTDNFFRLFGLEDVSVASMTPAEFQKQMQRLDQIASAEQSSVDGRLYAISRDDGSTRYIHVQETLAESRRIGVAEDVTAQVMERKRVEHERDHDPLTGIYNRRAFYRAGELLLNDKERLGIAVAVMIDLDNLKSMNDTYGHEWGDRYIMAGAMCIQEGVPKQSLVARVSGDEFSLLLYGFHTREEARSAVKRLQQSFQASRFPLPDGQLRCVGASGGFCFVDESHTDLKGLMKHADFAMYLIKRGTKGSFGEFDPEAFLASEVQQKKRRAFQAILQEHRIHYVYQPIVDARTGAIFGCEALLRVTDSEISSTEEFLRIARTEDELDTIEHLTWYGALAGFHRLIEIGALDAAAKVFINAQVSRLLNPQEQRRLLEQFGDIRDNTVMEIVETDNAPARLSRLQDEADGLFAREFALDDFGTGYNSDRNLLELMPRYVKLDMALVRNIHKYADRQLLMTGLITFAHDQNMLVLAEGVETCQELMCLLELGVDLLQGFLLAHPAQTPSGINPEAIAVIQGFAHRLPAAHG